MRRGHLLSLSALIPTLIATAAAWRAIAHQSWSLWGVAAMPPMTPSSTSFADLANVAATAQCIADGTDYTVCDPYGRPFQPYVVLPARLLALFGLGTDDTGAIGIALVAVYVATVAGLGVLLARRWRSTGWLLVAAQILVGALAVSAPAMLAVERGQIEIVTLAAAVVALVCFAPQTASIARGVLGAVASALAVVSKYFAIGLFLPSLRNRRPNLLMVAGLVISMSFLAVSWSDLQQSSAAARADQPTTSKSQFGAVTLISTLGTADPVGYASGLADNWTLVRVLGLILTLVAVIVAALLIPRAAAVDLDDEPIGRALMLGGAGVLVIPYALGASHDYRLIFLLPVAAGALMLISRRSGRAWWLAVLVLGGAVLAMVTGAAMTPTPSGFMWNKIGMVAGDLGLLVALAGCLGAWIRGFSIRPT